jgi:DNA end-binding protein Ku
VTAELKRRLDTAADQSGRSQSQEAEFRLERSFDHQDLLSEALTLAYGRKFAGIIMALGFVMDGAARSRQMTKDWTQEPESFERAAQAAYTLLTAARPQATPPNPTSSDPGWSFTNDFIEAIRGHKPDYPAMEQAANIKRLLGPIAERMTPEFDHTNPNRLAAAQPGATMAPRSGWKGYLKLSLVSASIAIYPATSSREKVGFNTLNRGTGNHQVEDDEPAELDTDSTHTVDIERFVPKTSIDDRYRDTPYYLVPEDEGGQEAFAVIRDAMKGKKMAAIARVVMARRKRIMMLEPFEKGIMGTLLHYSYEIRSEKHVFDEIREIELPNQMIGLAGDIIDRMTGEFEPEKFEQHIGGRHAQPSNVINLMDALRRSIERQAPSRDQAKKTGASGAGSG